MATYLLLLVLASLQVSVNALGSTALVAPITSSSGTDYFVKLQIGIPSQTQLLKLELNASVSMLTSCPASGKLLNDSVTLSTTNGSTDLQPFTVDKVHFWCQSGASAVALVALSTGKSALPAQFAINSGIARKFAYCLPPHGTTNPGPIFFGDARGYIFQSGVSLNISGVLSHTSLLETKHGYAVGLQGITLSGQSLQIKQQNLYISSVEPYTKLATSVYRALRTSFRTALYNITAAPAVAPFDTCFNASSFGVTRLGLGVPQINLHLANNVIWGIEGLNSMVSVSDSVVCLAFVDAGPRKPSVLGTFQQQDNLVEFDLEKSRLGFSGLLAFYRTICADFQF